MVEINNICEIEELRNKQQCSNVSSTSKICSADACKLPNNVKEKCKCYQRIPDFVPIEKRKCCKELDKNAVKSINDILTYSEFSNPDNEMIEKRNKLIINLKELREEEDQICGYYDDDNVFYPCGPDCCNNGEGCPGECAGAAPGRPDESYRSPENLLNQFQSIIEEKEQPADIITDMDKLFKAAIIVLISVTVLASLTSFIKMIINNR